MTEIDDDPPRPRRRGVVLGVLLLACSAGGLALLFRQELGDEWELRRVRRAAAADDPELPRHQRRFVDRMGSTQDERLDIAVLLAEDEDPKVRLAALDVLFANQPRAKKLGAAPDVGADDRDGAWRARVREAAGRLLADGDAAVRKKAIRMASELARADTFGSELAAVVRGGPPDERVIVAEGLAHWNGALLRDVAADPAQPDEVRAAALCGLDAYGDKQVAFRRAELGAACASALRAPNPDLRRAAIGALRYAERAPAAWLDVLCDDRHRPLHPLALRTWIGALGDDAHSARIWSDTHDAWFRLAADPVRCAVATHVLCAAARSEIERLEKHPPVPEGPALNDRQGTVRLAFDAQLARLGNVLSVVSAARWYCEAYEKPVELAVWLPFEAPAGVPPKRDLKAYLFREAKPVWEWCLNRADAYPTRFLGTNGIVRNYGRRDVPQPVPVRPLGAVLDELLSGPPVFERLRARYDPK
ncbi:MAG: hypothetical protein J0I06_10930 [Planctomycetes bacterium]|nr:hypothetical protein [Planctomycetota bacterium]